MIYKPTIKGFFRGWYSAGRSPLPLFSIIAILAILLFRIKIVSLAKGALTELSDLSAIRLFFLSPGEDASAALMIISVLLLIRVLPFVSPEIKIISAALFTAATIFSLLFFAEFFRLYESPFHPDYITAETGTGTGEFLASAVAETSLFSLISLISAIIILTGICFFLIKIQGADSKSPGLIPEGVRAAALPVTAALLIITALIPWQGLASSVSPDPQREARLAELTANPFVNLIRPDREKKAASVSTSSGSAEQGTLSLESAGTVNLKGMIPPGDYNIVFYFFESTYEGYTGLKINDIEVMPVFNSLKKKSIAMKRHYANYPLSANAMFSVFSSRYAPFARDLAIQKYPDVKVKAISEILKERGYATMLIHTGGLEYSGQNRYLAGRKFDRIIHYKDMMHTPPFNKKVGWGLDERSMIKPSSDFVAENRRSPWFISIHPVNPHHPYAVPRGYRGPADAVKKGDDAKTIMWKNYIDSLHYADFALGEIINALEAEESDRKTLFFIFADHGEAFYQHPGNYNHPLFIYEENIHVPFIIYSPGLIKKPMEVKTITRHIDIMPTVLSLLSMEIPRGSAGVPIFSRRQEQLAFIHTYWKDEYFGLVDQSWKYILKTRGGSEELYNLARDPAEKHNLIRENKETADLYRKQLEALRSRYTAENEPLFRSKQGGSAKR